MLKIVEPAVEKTTNMPSKEQLTLSFGNAVLVLQDAYRKKAGQCFEVVARHEYVEELHALAEQFGTTVQRKADADQRGIENVPSFVRHLAWADRSIGEELIKLTDEALEQVRTEADKQMHQCYKKCKEERSKGFLSLFRSELHYGDMDNVTMDGAGGWNAEEFRRLAHVSEEVYAIWRIRGLLRNT